MKHTRPPITLPRSLIFLASLWLLGSWLLSFGLRSPVHPSSASYEPGVQQLLLCVTIGAMVGWPLLRMSQSRTAYPIRQTLLDLFVILALVQVVVWLLRLVTTWSPWRTLAIDATLVGWIVLAAAIIASTSSTDRTGPRTVGMLACVAMCLLGPALAAIGLMQSHYSMTLIELSPLLAVRSLGAGGGALVRADQWQLIQLLWVAAVLGWIALLLATSRRSPLPGAGAGTSGETPANP